MPPNTPVVARQSPFGTRKHHISTRYAIQKIFHPSHVNPMWGMPLCPCCGEGLKQDWAKNQPIWLPHIFATNMQEAVQDTKNGTTRRLSGSTSHCHPRSESPITSSVMSQSYLIFQRNMCHAMCRGGDHCLADGCTGVGKFYEPGGVRQGWSTLTKGRYLV